ncbi:hypothetical protein BH23ACT8_BH23ACT8_24880 [soil metagenome]
MSDAQNRLVISLDDLATPSVEARVAELRAAAVPQTVRTVGSPTDAGARRWWRGGIASSAASGLLGGVAGWVISEVLTRPDSPGGPFADDPGLATALFLALFATGLATVMAGWEGIQLRSVRKAMPALARAVPLALIVGAFVGYLVQVVIYEPIIESALRRALAEQSAAASDAVLMNGVRIGRAIGFMVAGSALGLALGAASRSGKRAVNGLLGGAVGGFVGGFMFDAIGTALSADSGTVSRFVALVLTGALAGLAIGLVETARRDHWIEIVSGGMAGKQFILYRDQTTVGSDVSCDVTLIKDPSIAPIHATLVAAGPHLALRAASGAAVTVNGTAVTERQLQDHDLVQVGQTVLRYGARAHATPKLVAPPTA